VNARVVIIIAETIDEERERAYLSLSSFSRLLPERANESNASKFIYRDETERENKEKYAHKRKRERERKEAKRARALRLSPIIFRERARVCVVLFALSF